MKLTLNLFSAIVFLTLNSASFFAEAKVKKAAPTPTVLYKLLCVPSQKTASSVKCVALEHGEKEEAAGFVSVLSADGQKFKTSATVLSDSAGLLLVESNNRGINVKLDWKNFSSATNEIDGLVSVIDAGIGFKGRLQCGSEFSSQLVAICGDL